MSNIFAELQAMSSTDNTILDSRKELNSLVEYMINLPYQEEQIEFFSNLRAMKPETFKAVDGFMVLDDLGIDAIPKEFHHDSLGFVSGFGFVYSGRFVLPVKDVKGNVAGFVGYDKFETPKYLDSRNFGYKAKASMLYGMENMEKFYRDGYVIITEGSMCKLWLQEQGFNSLATLGSYLSPYVIQILRRFGRRCFVFPDSDEAGDKLKAQVRRELPEAQIRQCLYSKDIDDATKTEEGERDNTKVETFTRELHSLINNPFFRATQFSA